MALVPRELRESSGYWVYYLPESHYVGMTNNLAVRLSTHKGRDGRCVDNYKLLYHCDCPKTAAYHEALFQSVLGMEGLNGSQNHKRKQQ